MSIIAEIGQNHGGDISLAESLIDYALMNGAWAVKFQLYDSIKLYGEYHASELTYPQAERLFNYGKLINIPVFFSVFDVERVGWCKQIGVEYFKVAYSQRKNKKLIDAIDEIDDVGIFISGSTNIPIANAFYTLHCIPSYPAIYDQLDFGQILFDEWDGFSDHTIGLDAAKIALARGAEFIEKHFALDHDTGIDAKWSMTPTELKELVEWERTVKLCL